MSFGPAAGGEGGGGGAWSQEEPGGPSKGGGDPPTVDAAFKLQVEEGATVSATFPFFGDPEGGQLSFQIGDNIEVRIHGELKTTLVHDFFSTDSSTLLYMVLSSMISTVIL